VVRLVLLPINSLWRTSGDDAADAPKIL